MNKFMFFANISLMLGVGLYEFFTGKSVSSPNMLVVACTFGFLYLYLKDENHQP